jgi:hypothetical protein
MTSRYSFSNQSFMLDSKSFSMFFQNMSFQSVLLSNMFSAFLSNEISRSSSIKCIYCYEKNHLYKRKCVKFNENFKTKKIHLQKRRIHLDFYNFEIFHVRMILYKSQRQCVENAKKLIYSNRVVAASIEVHTIRLKKNAKIEFFIDEKKKEIVLVNHEFYANVNVILIAARSKFKIFKKFAKHHEFIKRILKRKIKKKKLFISKILRSKKWKKITMKKKNDVRNRVMKKVSQKNVQKRKKNSRRRKNVRDSFSTKKKIKSLKWLKKWKKFKKSLRYLRAKKSRISLESSTFEKTR